MRSKHAGVRLPMTGAGLAIGALASLSLAAPPAETAAPGAHVCADCCAHDHAGEAQPDAARALIEAHTFFALPKAHQDEIAAKLRELGEPVPSLGATSPEPNAALEGRDLPMTVKEFQIAWAQVEPWDVCTRAQFSRFRPVHQRLLVAMCERVAGGGYFMASPCFVPGTDENLVNAVSDIISFGRVNNPNPRFEQITRWVTTASNPAGTGAQGEPVTLTYSFPPDGTFVASGVGEGDGTNDLNAFLDGIYGDRATWRAIYDDVFARWGELSGNTYILEPNDDGADVLFNENNTNGIGIDANPGVLGVRGDLRMLGKPIDGNSGTLAYNFFPEFGDMVLDTADNFYENTTSNSIRLRNILAHEHGHGMGQLHVCPIQENKLMEPFISVAFDGPQFDDMLNAQRHYGDPNEPNDTPAEATDLGSFGTMSSFTVGAAALPDVTGSVTLDDDNDIDYYRVTITQDAELTATITPLTQSYDAGPQTFFCSGAAPYNPLLFLNPKIELIAPDGTTVLETGAANPAGLPETVVRTLTPGDYYIRLTGTNPNGDEIIAYRLDVETDLPGFIGIDLGITGGLPELLAPQTPEIVEITINENQDSLDGPPLLLYQIQSAAMPSSVPFASTGGNTWQATLPGLDCGDDPELSVVVDTLVEGALSFPTGGPATATVASGGEILIDNVETDIGWSVESTASDGIWERGVPQNNGRDDPPADFDGSGQCWLTGQTIGNPNSDVDEGYTRLISPVFDYSSGGTISYAYWASDSLNPIGPEDGFTVDYSTDGGDTWTEIRDYTTAGFWRVDTIDVTAEIGTPATLQIRFVAADEDPGNVLECAVDQIIFDRIFCENPTNLCIADFDGDGDVDLTDFGVFGAAFGSVSGDANYNPGADLDNDGDVDLTDFGIFGSEFGRTDCLP